MVNHCCVPRCDSKARRSTKRFHRFPRDVEMCKLWLVLMNHRLSTGAISRDSVKHLRVCSDHFCPEDYRKLSLNNSLKTSAVPSAFPWTGPRCSGTQGQNLGLKDEPSPNSQPDHKHPIDQQHPAAPRTASTQRLRSKGQHQKVCYEKENTPSPFSPCFEVEEKSWCKAIKSLQTNQGNHIFKGSEVLVDTQCLLELFQYCWLCQIECCITIEGHERLFSVTQDCQSCGYHKEWRSHPVVADEPVETSHSQHTDHEQHKDGEELPNEHMDEDAASYLKVEHKPDPVDGHPNEVEVQIVPVDDEGTEQNSDTDRSYSSSMEEESEQEEEEKTSSDHSGPNLVEVASDSEVSLDKDGTSAEINQGNVVMWCTVCKTDAMPSCSHHKKMFTCGQCSAGDSETHSSETPAVQFDDFPSLQDHAEKEHGGKAFWKLFQECGKLINTDPKSSGSKDNKCEHKLKHIVCPECGKRFLTEVGLEGHYNRLHQAADHRDIIKLKRQTHPLWRKPL